MRLRLGKVTVADVLAAQPVTTNLLKFMRASIKMIGVSNLQSFIEARINLSRFVVTGCDVLAAQPVTTNLLKFMRASIKMIGVSNLQSFIASMTQKLTLSDISDESKNYLDKAGITTACLRIKSKWTAGGK